MSDTWSKIKLLSWKNLRLAYHHPFITVTELVFPVVVVAVLVFIRSYIGAELIRERTFAEFSPTYSNNLRTYQMFYSPNTSSAVRDIMAIVMDKTFKCAPNCKPMPGFSTAEQLETGLTGLKITHKVGIVFPDTYKNKKALPPRAEYTLRFPSEMLYSTSYLTIPNWMTNILYPVVLESGTRETHQKKTASPCYAKENFLALQSYVSQSIAQARLLTPPTKVTEVMMRRFPYPPYYNDSMMGYLQTTMGFIIIFAFSFSVISLLKVIVMEKQKLLLESMKIMGLAGHLHWIAWLLKQLTFETLSIICILVLLTVNLHISAVFQYSNGFLIFILLFMYALATTTLCFAISVCFNTARLACTIGIIFYFALSLPYLALTRASGVSWGMKFIACLSTNTAISYGFQMVVAYETAGFGIQWINIFRPVTPHESITLAQIYLMLGVDTAIHLLFTIYIESVFPGKHSVGKKWNYIFTWMKRKKDVAQPDQPEIEIEKDPTRYEEEPADIPIGIDIRGLTKKFGREKTVVHDLNLKLYENQITVILGHNLAGRTATIAMLTGMLKPTSGTAIINGYDLATQITLVRKSLGLCPQNNCLFDELSVVDHIYFYTRLKGITDTGYIKSEIKTYLNLLHLTESRNLKTEKLSSEMKRRLAIAIAFCGGSKIVLLDEPTCEMDLSSQFSVREFILSQKEDRTIMVTTHFMDEAEMLADRIAVMSHGVLQCCGSSRFLKKNYGAGYYLVIDKLPNCSEAVITKTIQQYIPDRDYYSNMDTSLNYHLPDSYVPKFEEMLYDLETNMADLKIAKLAISVITLEEIFLRTGSYTALTMHDKEIFNLLTPSETHRINMRIENRKKGIELRFNQVKAMFLKRYLNTKRNWFRLLLQILAPLTGLVIGYITSNASIVRELPNLPIRLNTYEGPKILLQQSGHPMLYTVAQEWLDSLETNYTVVPNIHDFVLRMTVEKPGLMRMRYLIGMEINATKIVGWFNNIPHHTPPLVLNFIFNCFLKSINYEYDIKLNNHPLPHSSKTTFYLWGRLGNVGFELACSMGLSLGFTIAMFTVFYTQERICRMKHLQFVSGVHAWILWAVSLLWDWFIYIIIVSFTLMIVFYFQKDGFKTGEELLRLFVMFMYFGYAMLPCIVVLSFCFTTPATAFTFSWLIAFVGHVMFFVIWISHQQDYRAVDILYYMDWIFLLCPVYALMAGINNVYLEYARVEMCKKSLAHCVNSGEDEYHCWQIIALVHEECWPDKAEYWIWNKRGILRNITVSFVMGTLMLILLALIEGPVFTKLAYACSKHEEYVVGRDLEENVLAERRKVLAIRKEDRSKYNFIAHNLTNKYGKNVIIRGLTFKVDKGECFGLLGVNKAGKSSFFRTITGEKTITSGNIYVRGINLKYHRQKLFRNVGYCPQLDALFDDLTAREIIKIFALLRGYRLYDSNHMAEKLAVEFDFTPQLNTLIKNLSSGARKKVSISIALIGDPSIVYLDEPTSGLGPATKRRFWNSLRRLRDDGKTLIVGTQSMEETEELCTKFAIIVNGQFKCIGSKHYLKHKYAQGILLVAKISKRGDVEEGRRQLINFVSLHFPTSRIVEDEYYIIKFYIPSTPMQWSEMFGLMESAKESLPIAEYTLGQSTLEHAFLKFTKEQM